MSKIPDHNECALSDSNTDAAKKQISYLNIFWTFFRIGLFTLGGGLSMAVVIRHELVLKRRWIKDRDFLAEMSTATLIPGAIAVNMAFLQGRRLKGKGGATMAISGTILPSFCIILLIAWFALPYFSHPLVSAFLRGCAIAVVALLAFASYIFGRKYLRKWSDVIVCAVGLFAVAVLGLHPVWGIFIAGALGYSLCESHDRSRRSDCRD